MSIPYKDVEDDYVDRLQVEAQRCVGEPSSTNDLKASIKIRKRIKRRFDYFKSSKDDVNLYKLQEQRDERVNGGDSERETPLPIPNRAVKPLSADGTGINRESRSPPTFFSI